MALSPRRATPVSNALFGTLLFATAEAMLFTGLCASFLVLRSQYVNWPPLGQPRLPVEVTGVNTLVLLASGFACERAARLEARVDAVRWLGIAGILGAVFLVSQGREWVELVAFGLTGTSVYGSLFYSIVGTHAAHVAVSLGVLALVLAKRWRGTWGRDQVSAFRAWWWFVVGIWPALYAMVYLW